MTRSRPILFFWGAVLVLLFSGVVLYFNLHRRPSAGNIIVLKVNDRKMNAREFSEKLAGRLRGYDAVLAKDDHVVSFAKNKIVENFIHDSLVLDWAKRNSISVSQDEIEAEVKKIRASYPDSASFKEAISETSESLAAWEGSIAQDLLQKKVFDLLEQKIPPPDETEIKSYYNSNKDQFHVKPQVRIRQIVLDSEDIANRIYHSLTPKTPLGPLAKKYSKGPEASRDGDVGWVERGTLDIFDKAFSLSLGQRLGVLKSPYGYHIIEVTGKRAEQTLPLSEVHSKIERILRSNKEQAAYSSWLEGQLKIAKVFKNDDVIGAIDVRIAGE